MRSKWILIAVIVLLFAASLWVKILMRRSARDISKGTDVPRRIASTAPCITETLFELGLGDRVVGVTQFCKFPPEAATREKIGGHLDMNFEKLVALKPDLVIMLDSHEDTRAKLEQLDIPTLTVNHRSIDGLLDSMVEIGRRCGAEDRAQSRVAAIRQRIDLLAAKTADLPRPRVLVAVDRTLGAGRIEDLYISGNEGHLNYIVELAGGKNVYEGGIRFPVVSCESIIKMNPEIVLDFVSEAAVAQHGQQSILADWRQVAQVDAVRNNRVYVVADDHATIPGPNFVDVVETVAKLIHPEINDYKAATSGRGMEDGRPGSRSSP